MRIGERRQQDVAPPRHFLAAAGKLRPQRAYPAIGNSDIAERPAPWPHSAEDQPGHGAAA